MHLTEGCLINENRECGVVVGDVRLCVMLFQEDVDEPEEEVEPRKDEL